MGIKIDIVDKLKVLKKLLDNRDKEWYDANPAVIQEAIDEIEKLRHGLDDYRWSKIG